MSRPACCRPMPARRWRAAIIRHGVAANRKVLETIAQYSLEQGLTPRPAKLEEIFAASMMNQ